MGKLKHCLSYGPLEDQYAVLVHGSIGFSNYRHLADVLNVYRNSNINLIS